VKSHLNLRPLSKILRGLFATPGALFPIIRNKEKPEMSDLGVSEIDEAAPVKNRFTATVSLLESGQRPNADQAETPGDDADQDADQDDKPADERPTR
jgi:hypothetical protein